MPSTITTLFSYGTIFSHISFVFLLLAYFGFNSWGREIILFVGKRAILFGFIVTFVGLVGSLIYSSVLGYAPCELCWWQRIFLFPQAFIFLIALYKKDNGVFKYVVPLSVLASIISLYHTYIQLGGTTSVLPCTATGAACTKVFVLQFGYITIPTMALTISLYVLLLALIRHRSNAL